MSSLMSGYIDRSGSFAIAPTMRRAGAFEGGIANVVPYGGWDFGFLLRDGSWLIEPELKFFDGFDNGICSYNVGGQRDDRGRVVGGQWGWVGQGRVLAIPQFQNVGRYADELIAVQVGERWGYADKEGNIRIQPSFEYAGDFSNGVAVATSGGKDGYIRPDGGWLLPPQYEQLSPYCPGRGRMRQDEQTYLIDTAGNVLSEGYDTLYPINDGLARAQRGDAITFINNDGKPVTDQWFEDARPYSDGMAPVRRGDEWFLLTVTGQVHGPFFDAQPAQDGLARFVPPGEAVGYMRADGTAVVPPTYGPALGFSEGLAGVCLDGKWTFIDTSGQQIHAPHWDMAMGFQEGLAAVRHEGKWGVIDRTGEVVVPPAFDSIARFSDGLAAARRVDWPAQVSVPEPTWHCMPREGLHFRGFENCGPDDDIRLTLCFSETPDSDHSLRLQQIVGNWRDLLEFGTGGRDVIKDNSLWIADYALSLRLVGVADPVRAVDLLLSELKAIGMPIKDVVLGRFREDPTLPMPLQITLPKKIAAPHPDDPRGETHFPTFEAYAAIAFDPNQTPPNSESLQHLVAGRWNPRREELVHDERLFTLHLPDIRVCYGATQENVVEPDARSQQVGEATRAALAKMFDPQRIWVFPGNQNWVQPAPVTRDNEPGVEKIHMAGRTGYCFFLECQDLLQDVGPDVFRYREPELMEALGEVIRQLGLLPCIMWQRFGDPLPGPAFPGSAHPMNPTSYAVNLWER